MEIQLQDDGWRASLVATMEQLGGIHEVVSNASPKHKAGLISAN
jgi:hypothetical protein